MEQPVSDQQVPAAGWSLSTGSLLLLGRNQYMWGHVVSDAFFLFVCLNNFLKSWKLKKNPNPESCLTLTQTSSKSSTSDP